MKQFYYTLLVVSLIFSLTLMGCSTKEEATPLNAQQQALLQSLQAVSREDIIEIPAMDLKGLNGRYLAVEHVGSDSKGIALMLRPLDSQLSTRCEQKQLLETNFKVIPAYSDEWIAIMRSQKIRKSQA